jgi:hypothetical protein
LEIKRWGNRVVVTDNFSEKSPDEILQSMAMAPPADDNDRWQFTVYGASNDPALTTFVRKLEVDPYLAPFFAPNPANNNLNWAHLVVIHTDDVMQKWRVAKIPGPYPVMTIQAPRNGYKGDPTVIIDYIHPSDVKDAADLQKRITASITLWNKKLAKEGFQPPRAAVDNFYGAKQVSPPEAPPATKGGHSQTPPWGPTPPPPATPVNPIWPVNGPAVATVDVSPLTVAQIQEAAPGAPPAFILEQYNAKVTDKNAVALAWLVYKEAHPTPATPVSPAPSPQPMTPVPVTPTSDPLVLLASLAAIFLSLLKAWEVIAPLFGFSGKVALLLEKILSQLPMAPKT